MTMGDKIDRLCEESEQRGIEIGEQRGIKIGEQRGEQRGMQKMLAKIIESAEKVGIAEEIEKFVNEYSDINQHLIN